MKGIRYAPVILTLLLAGFGAQAQDERSPEQVVDATANEIQSQLNGRRDYLEDNPDELYEIVDSLLLPNFDVAYAGRLVMGKHWRDASDEDRRRFIRAFYSFLVRKYALGILEFDEGEVEILGSKLASNGKKSVVKTQVFLENGTAVPVDYSLRMTSKGWKAYDVKIEGVSYVQNYRNQFNSEISAKGLDGVIQRLETYEPERETEEAQTAGESAGTEA